MRLLVFEIKYPVIPKKVLESLAKRRDYLNTRRYCGKVRLLGDVLRLKSLGYEPSDLPCFVLRSGFL